MSEAFGVRQRGELVNAVLTDRGRLVLRTPAGRTGPIAFDAKRPAEVEVLGPTDRRLSGSRGGAERTQLVEVSSRGGRVGAHHRSRERCRRARAMGRRTPGARQRLTRREKRQQHNLLADNRCR